MATWGEFMSEFKITNMKGKVFIDADQVLDVWEERNKLRKELAELKGDAPPPPPPMEAQEAEIPDVTAAVAAERERCARDVEEFAEACAAEPDQPEYIGVVLRAAAELIRGRGGDAASAEAPAAAEDTSLEGYDAEQLIMSADIPPAEVPAAEPVEHETMQE